MNSNMYCEILQQSMIPSLQKLGCRAVFQHDNDYKHTSKTTIALLKRLRVKLAKHVSWLEHNKTSLGDPQAVGGGVQSLKYLPAPRRRQWRCTLHSPDILELHNYRQLSVLSRTLLFLKMILHLCKGYSQRILRLQLTGLIMACFIKLHVKPLIFLILNLDQFLNVWL